MQFDAPPQLFSVVMVALAAVMAAPLSSYAVTSQRLMRCESREMRT